MTVAYGSWSGQRGQTVPVWVVATLLTLTLTFFVFNYANTVRWQIRAQNAADSAAIALLGQDAAAANSLTTLMYALNIQELRVRSVENAVQTLVLQGDLGASGSCGGLTGLLSLNANCITDATNLVSAYANDTTAYANLVTDIGKFAGQISGLVGSSTDANKLLSNTLFASGTPGTGAGCVKLNTDCSFKYTASVAIITAGTPVTVDVYACRKVPSLAATFLGLTGSNSAFYAIGHSRLQLAPLSQGQFSPGSAVDPATSNVYQPVEKLLPGLSATGAFGTNFLGLQVNTGFLVPQPAPPGSGIAPARSSICPA